MIKENAAVVVCDSSDDVEKAIGELRDAGFDVKQISLAGRDNGFLDSWGSPRKPSKTQRNSAKSSSFWIRVQGLLGDEEFYDFPGMGRVVLAGPIADWVAVILDHVPMFGGMSALGAGLYSIGISKEKVFQYENALKEGRYLLLIHGASAEVAWAQEILDHASHVRKTGS
jgi:hypothetical protein